MDDVLPGEHNGLASRPHRLPLLLLTTSCRFLIWLLEAASLVVSS
jgi:hypothetical protein